MATLLGMSYKHTKAWRAKHKWSYNRYQRDLMARRRQRNSIELRGHRLELALGRAKTRRAKAQTAIDLAQSELDKLELELAHLRTSTALANTHPDDSYVW